MDPNMPSLAIIKRTKGEEASTRIVSEFIMAANDFFNVSVKMNPAQVAITSEMVIEKYYYLRVAEIKLCFRNAMFGEYGEIYNRIDGSVIFSWLQKYDASRTSIVAQANQKMSANLTEALAQTITPELIKEITDKLIHQEKPMDMTIVKLSPFEKMVQDEWDKIPLSTAGYGLKLYVDTLVDFTNYRRLRAEEEVLKHGQHDTNEIPPLSNF
jgi:hypothetical protein